ncbi:hypothetical protein Ancab_005485 [Ancistrocladus abbreviatus]
MASQLPLSTNWDSLPGEIQFDILTRVPALDLSRLKSACKSWLNLISDSYFVKAQLANTCRNSELSFLVIDVYKRQGYDADHHLGYAIDDDGRATRLYDLKIDLKAVPGVPKESYIKVLSSCDGVILLSASSCYDYSSGFAGQQLFLCNPITRASYRLHSFPVIKNASLGMQAIGPCPMIRKLTGRPKWKVHDRIAEVFKEPNVVHSNGSFLLSRPKSCLPGSYFYFQGRSYRFCIQSGKMEVWTAKNWEPNCWAKEDVLQLDPPLLSKLAEFEQTIVQPIASRRDKIFLLISCRYNMPQQLALLDLRSRKVKPIRFDGDGQEFGGRGRISRLTSIYNDMWGSFDFLCHVGSLLQLP